MVAILCKCGHRKYKHSPYPIDAPHCKGEKWHWYHVPIVFGCRCRAYDDTGNLELLEWLSSRRVDKNKKGRKV